jgi:RimJ/RimL family protein N-acetyltransferase
MTSARTEAECVLTTERLGFRPWRSEDLDFAIGLWGDPEVTRFISAKAEAFRAEVGERLAREISLQSEHGFQCWADLSSKRRRSRRLLWPPAVSRR